jgi:ABC-type Mn2+/Zn2+ transport system ATPase subunit
MVSHDLDIVAAHADHVILLDRTVIRQGPPAEVLVPAVLDQAFGRHGAHA